VIKFTASGNGITLVGLGLEPGNITRMQAGQPVRVKLSDLGFTGATGTIQILIFTGKSAAEMQKSLEPFISPETVLYVIP
jgi:hypothetical protein